MKQKSAEKTELSRQKKNTGFFNPIRHIQLNQQITTLTEEIEELDNRKSALLIHLGCTKESETKNISANLQKMSDTVEKLAKRQETLEQQKTEETIKFREWKSKVPSDQRLDLLDERIALRENHRHSLIGRLQEVFGKVFSNDRLRDASDTIDYHLKEDPDIVRIRAMDKWYKQEQEKALNSLPPEPKRSRGRVR